MNKIIDPSSWPTIAAAIIGAQAGRPTTEDNRYSAATVLIDDAVDASGNVTASHQEVFLFPVVPQGLQGQ